jgi:hypothetical protein
MHIHYYAPHDIQAGDRLSRIIVEMLPADSVIIHRSLIGLIQTLRSRNAAEEVVVLMPGNRQELSEVCLMHDDFQNVRLVLVLYDEDSDTIAMAHRLRPRYVSYANADFIDLMHVLKKMLENFPAARSWE